LKALVVHPKSSSFVMLTTVVVVVATHDLAKGVLAGVLLSTVFFAMKVERLFQVKSEQPGERERIYCVSGQIFFVSAEAFTRAFDLREKLDRVEIDFTHAHFWDLSAVGALDKVVLKFRRNGTTVELIGLNEASSTIIDRLAIHDQPGALDQLAQH
jgi:SulP family sulfate permease